MTKLEKWENIIKNKRKNTDYKKYLKDILSWCSLTYSKNNGLVTKYPVSGRIKGVMKKKEFENHKDPVFDNGLDYIFSINFFENLKNLFNNVYFTPTMQVGENENSEYADAIGWSKNVYLSYGIVNDCESVFYSFSVKESSKNIYNSIMVRDQCENVYMSSGVLKGFNIFYSKFIYNSSDIWFCTNMIGCKNCLLCDNLENKSFCINNIQYKKEKYFELKEKMLKEKSGYLHGFGLMKNDGINIGSENVTGNFILFSNNIENGKYVYRVENGKNLLFVGGIEGNKNMYDVFTGGALKGDDFYGIMGGSVNNNIYNSCYITNSSNIHYSYHVTGSSYCIGCYGLKNKSFCILNKQYTKEEWYELADKIFTQMNADGILGDFFPGELNPFYFNDTMAYLIEDTFTKEEVEKDGYMWRDEKISVDIPEGAEVVKSTELNSFQGYDSSGRWQINKEILKKVIVDKNGNYYRIVQMEYDFLVKYGLPIPEIHWLDRIKLGFKF